MSLLDTFKVKKLRGFVFHFCRIEGIVHISAKQRNYFIIF